MKKIILDLGSGNSCRNNKGLVYEMIDSIPNDPRIILKWQLFQQAGNNIPLERQVFTEAYQYARNKGFLTTASVFDEASLSFLLTFRELPFIKIANQTNLYPLIDKIPRGISAYASWNGKSQPIRCNEKMCCVSKYPAADFDYYKSFSLLEMEQALSDHTIGIDFALRLNPTVYECHYKLFGATGPDAGAFAKYPHEIKELCEMR